MQAFVLTPRWRGHDEQMSVLALTRGSWVPVDETCPTLTANEKAGEIDRAFIVLIDGLPPAEPVRMRSPIFGRQVIGRLASLTVGS